MEGASGGAEASRLEASPVDGLRSLPVPLRGWLAAKFLSDTGSALNLIVLGIYALEVLASATALGVLLALRLGGTVLGGAIAPRLAKLKGNRALMIAADLSSAALVLMLVVTPQAFHAALLFPLVALLGICHGAFHVALFAEVPTFVGQRRRHALNAALSAIDGLGIVLGGLLAAILTAAWSYDAIFALNAASYAVSGLVLLALGTRLPRRTPESEGTATKGSDVPAAHPGRAIGRLRALLRTASIALPLLLLVRFGEAFGSAAHNVGFPILSERFAPTAPAMLYGLVMAAWGGGRLVAASFVPHLYGRLEVRGTRLDAIFVATVIATFAMFVGVFALAPLAAILVAATLAGVFDTATETAYYSILQSAPDDQRTALVSVSYVVERGGMGIGMIGVGALFATAGLLEGVLAYYGAGIALAVVVLVLLHMRSREERTSP